MLHTKRSRYLKVAAVVMAVALVAVLGVWGVFSQSGTDKTEIGVGQKLPYVFLHGCNTIKNRCYTWCNGGKGWCFTTGPGNCNMDYNCYEGWNCQQGETCYPW